MRRPLEELDEAECLNPFLSLSSETRAACGARNIQCTKNTLFRCFLEGGGSTDSFFVREDLPVSSIIIRFVIKDCINLSDIQVNSVLGQLRVIGDVGRDVLLTLSDPGASPVSIQVGGGDVVMMMMMMAMIMMTVMTSPPRRQAGAQPALF